MIWKTHIFGMKLGIPMALWADPADKNWVKLKHELTQPDYNVELSKRQTIQI